MNTYIWADTMYYATEYDFLVAVADSLEEAKELVKEQINKLQYRKKEDFWKVLDECPPIIIEGKKAMMIVHSNE